MEDRIISFSVFSAKAFYIIKGNVKFKNGEIGIEFIWIDIDNPPSDAIGWVAKNK